MIVRLLIYIKHRIPFIWHLVELVNGALFSLLHKNKMLAEASRALAEVKGDYQLRFLGERDLRELSQLLQTQSKSRVEFFKPHKFNLDALNERLRDPAFIMFGAFAGERLVGYFFLRCFWNRKCFVGRLIDAPYERRGIGRMMNWVMYTTAWRAGFRCLTTVSKNNSAVMRSHANNPVDKVIRPLSGGYQLVEFIDPKRCDDGDGQ